MQQVYNNVVLKNGSLKSGLNKIFIAPKEWATNSVVIDFATGKVLTALTFADGKDFYELQFTPLSGDMVETQKTGRSGDFFDIEIKGIVNNVAADTQQILQSFKNHELICLAHNKDRSIKIIGNTEHAMRLSIANKNSQNINYFDITLKFESENLSPFYEV